MNPRPPAGAAEQRDELKPAAHRTIAVEQVGVDEVSIVPWMMMLPRRLAVRAGLTRKWITMLVVLVGLFSTSVTITILVVSLDPIAVDLGSSVSTLNWSITGPMLAFAVVGPAFGKLGDLYGHRRLFILGLGFAGVFAALTAVAWDVGSMLTFRILSAVAGSATGPAAMAYVNRLFEPHERVRPLSLWSFTTTAAPVVGVVIGGPLVESIGWRSIFVAQAPLCLLGAAIAAKLLPQTSRGERVRFDVAGSVTLGLGAMLLLLGINRSTHWGWTSPAILAVIVIGVAALAMFVSVERRTEAPLMPLAWMRTRNVVLPVSSMALTNFAYMGGFIMVPQLLHELGLSPAHVGWLIISRPLAFAISAPLCSSFTMRVGERTSGVIGAVLVVVSMVMLSMVGRGTPDIVVIVGLALSGVGLGMASPAMTALVANAVEETSLGVAGALQQLLSQMGAVIGSTVMVAIHESTRVEGSVDSYGFAMLAGAGSAAAGMACAWFVRSTARREELI